jgi:hypothetical protein
MLAIPTFPFESARVDQRGAWAEAGAVAVDRLATPSSDVRIGDRRRARLDCCPIQSVFDPSDCGYRGAELFGCAYCRLTHNVAGERAARATNATG